MPLSTVADYIDQKFFGFLIRGAWSSGGEHTALGFPNWTLDTLRLYLINILGDHHDAIDDDDDGIDGDHHHHMQG